MTLLETVEAEKERVCRADVDADLTEEKGLAFAQGVESLLLALLDRFFQTGAG